MADISGILRDWPFDPASCVRKVTCDDGREVVQVRTPLGIEQYELHGRPDGLRPDGHESVLERVEADLARHADEPRGTDAFEIDTETAAELQHEGLLYYYRYLVCFQVGEYEITASDTLRNLRMFDLLREHCKDEQVVHSAEQYRPYVVRMNAAARALMAVGQGKYSTARSVIQHAIDKISELHIVPTPVFELERRRSLAILRGMRKAIPEEKSPTAEDVLKQELHRAIAAENYERAAQLRDQLKELQFRPRESSNQPSDRRS